CTTRKQKAEKSCLVCLASYCETHLQSHYEYPALMKHKLVKATGQMREKMCAQHDKLLEAFCRTDETSVCVLCMMDEHKHHDIVPAGTERTEKQRIKKWQDLRQSVDAVKHSAQMVLDENERIFTELLLSIERKYNEVKEMIRSHEKSTVTRGEILLDRLEEEITLLKKRHNDLEKLSHTDDHIHFLQSWQSLSGPSGYEDLNNISVVPNYNFDSTKRAISAMRLQIEEVSKTEMSKISGAQVLCRDSVTGTRCYWEVDWKGTEIDVAVTYRGIRRKGNGNDCSLGWNDRSWSLYCSDSKFSFVHNNKSKDIQAPTSPRIGVYLDHAAGTLAFYSVSENMRLLHRVQTTFTEPLYPAFSVWGFGTSI
uniref:B30.2/SPRY domain-containing protein n=1 Tax=Amphiprion percula TaxID=161767 RepID=A0A3P8T0A2_AMPPE